MFKQIICKECVKNCVLDIYKEDDKVEVTGNACNGGVEYANLHINNKSDIFTTLVRMKGAPCNVVSVKSSKPIDKRLWVECSKALSRIYVGAPIKAGDVVCKNILNIGVDIICTKNVSKCS